MAKKDPFATSETIRSKLQASLVLVQQSLDQYIQELKETPLSFFISGGITKIYNRHLFLMTHILFIAKYEYFISDTTVSSTLSLIYRLAAHFVLFSQSTWYAVIHYQCVSLDLSAISSSSLKKFPLLA